MQRRTRLLKPVPVLLRIAADYGALIFGGVFFASAALYAFAGGVLEAGDHATYWLLKFLFVVLVASTGIVISSVLEECVIVWLSRPWVGGHSFYTSVLRANYITLGAVLLVAAGQMLPRRFHSPHFITSWLYSLTAVFA